jgi:hypothetical protein
VVEMVIVGLDDGAEMEDNDDILCVAFEFKTHLGNVSCN